MHGQGRFVDRDDNRGCGFARPRQNLLIAVEKRVSQVSNQRRLQDEQEEEGEQQPCARVTARAEQLQRSISRPSYAATTSS